MISQRGSKSIPHISIIIPVYNVDAYISNCLDTVCAQTLSDIEIIIVNDGSTDNSPAICRKYAESDSRIRYIEQKNQGIASARNAGLYEASGEYIGFVDPDDWIEPDMYEQMYDAACKANADIVCCNAYNNESDKRIVYIKPGTYDREGIKKTIFPRLLACYNKSGYECSFRWYNWMRIYRTALLKEYNITFDSKLRKLQDMPFTFRSTIHSSVYCYLGNSYLYHYRMNSGSVTSAYQKEQWKYAKELIFVMREYISEFTEYDFSEQMQMRSLFLIFDCIYNETKKTNPASLSKRIRNVKAMVDDSEIRSYINGVSFPHVSFGIRLRLICYKYRLYLALYVISETFPSPTAR